MIGVRLLGPVILGPVILALIIAMTVSALGFSLLREALRSVVQRVSKHVDPAVYRCLGGCLARMSEVASYRVGDGPEFRRELAQGI